MSGFLFRLGRGSAARPWRTICAWLGVIVAATALATTLGGEPHDDYNVPDAAAQAGIEALRAHLPQAGYATAEVVVHDRSGAALQQPDLATLTEHLQAMPHALTVSPPQLSADGDTALLTVGYDVEVTDAALMGHLEPLESAIAPTVATGLQVELSGDVPASAAAPMRGIGEMVGIVSALLILVLTLGSVVAAGLPLAVAITGLGVGSGGIALLAATMDVSTSAPTVATMVGLGVGIDYALLLVTRHVEFLRQGYAVEEAAGRAVATAGRSVVFAASTVLVSLLGLRLSGLQVYASFCFATGLAVIAVAAAALSLLPALMRLGGRRLLPRKVRRALRPVGLQHEGLTARWAARVGRRPLAWAVLAATVMITLALPVLDMRTWPQDPSTGSPELTTRRAYDLIAGEFGPGANGPLTVVVDRTRVSEAQTGELAAGLAARDDIVTVHPTVVSPDGAIAVIDAVPAYGPTDEHIPAMIEDLRAELPEGAQLTGMTAMFADIAALLADRLWLVIGFVVCVSVVLLALVFRSVVVPIKAAVMNLLSIGAAYGVMTAVFQWGWGTSLLGLDHSVPVSSWVPILMFTILFGLSMDYEVFLLSRVREDYARTGDPHGSVVRGLAATGRVISSAAAIMVAVFLGFAAETDVVVKMLGVGMAVSILLDATLVRMVLVPATMAMLGRRNWWLPGWLDRLLPQVRAEVDDLPVVPASEKGPVGVLVR